MPESRQPDDYTPAEAVLAEFLDRTDRGEKLDREEFIRDHPEVAAELGAYFDDLDTVNMALGDTHQPPARDGQELDVDFPRDFGSYVLLEKLGAGGMGEVYKAEHRRMERVVAVKTLHSKALDSPEAVERFHREVKAAGKLSHPNVVTAHDAGDVEGVHFLAMEYVDGGDLHWLVDRGGRLAVEQAVDYVIQAARGLEYAHRKNVIHRDVKPANLLLDREGTVKVLDLGLARLEIPVSPDDPTGSGSLTQFGQIMGTIDYMSPEQALNTKRASAPADVYSTGCTLFYLLTGQTVYGGETPMERIVAHREDPIPSLSEVREDVPEALDAVFQQMVAKKPEDRQASMSQVIEQFESCIPAEAREAGPWPFPPPDEPGTEMGGSSSEAPAEDETTDLATVGRAEDSSLEMMPRIDATSDLSDRIRRKTSPRRKRKVLVTTLVAAALTVVVFGIVIKIQTRDGTLVLGVSEPGAKIEVLDEAGSVEISRRGERGPLRISVDPGTHRLRVEKKGFAIYTDEFTIDPGGTQELSARLEPLARDVASTQYPTAGPRTTSPANVTPRSPPPLAVAPFTAEEAKQHQQAWAKYLGVPVEHENSIGMKMVLIPPGEFMMGSSEELVAKLIEESAQDQWWTEATARAVLATGIRHKVRITRPFYMGACEVTVGQFQDFTEATAFRTQSETDGRGGLGWIGDDGWDGKYELRPEFTWRTPGFEQTGTHPVVFVSWDNASAFCKWLSQHDRHSYQLPTEAQWEYACRAGTTTRFYFGDDKAKLHGYAWLNRVGGHTSKSVGLKLPNAFGLYDLIGNVFELCWDWYGEDYYRASEVDDPTGPPSGMNRVRRGSYFGGPLRYLSSSARSSATLDYSEQHTGFRVIRMIDVPSARDKPATNEPAAKPSRPEEPEPPAMSDPSPKAITQPAPASAQSSSKLGPAENVIPGIVPRPAKLSGIGRWQVDSAAPRETIYAIAWSPDGQLIACGTHLGHVRLYDATTLRLSQLLMGGSGSDPVSTVAWSPDGKWLASADAVWVRLWHSDGRPGPVLEGHTNGITSISWSPDGRLIASAGADGTVRLWRVDGTSGPVLDAGVGSVHAVAFGPDDAGLASGHADGTVRLWSSDGTSGPVLEGHTSAALWLAWKPDGELIASSAYDGTVRLWSTDGTPGLMLKEGAGPVAWSPDGQRLALASYKGLHVYHADGTPRWLKAVPGTALSGIAWSPDGQQLVSAHWPPSLRFWEADGESGPMLEGHFGGVNGLAWRPDGKRLASASSDSTVRLWQPNGSQVAVLEGHTDRATSVAWSPSGQTLVSTSVDRTVQQWSADGNPGRVLKGHSDSVNSVSWKPDGDRFATGSSDRTVRVWEIDGTPGPVLHGHSAGVRSVSWSHDGSYLASGGDDKAIHLWEAGEVAGLTLEGHRGPVASVAWHPTTLLLASTGDLSDDLWLWQPDKTSGTQVYFDYAFLSLCWSPSGKSFAAGRPNCGNVHLYLANGTPGPMLTVPEDVRSVTWHPDERQLASGGFNGIICLSDTVTMQPKWVAVVLKDGKFVTFSAAGEVLYGEPEVVENELVYVVETPSGAMELLKPSEFQKRVSAGP